MTERGKRAALWFALDFFLIHIPEAFVLFYIGLCLYGLPLRLYGYRAFTFSLLYAIPCIIFSVYAVNLPIKMAGLWIWMIILFRMYLRESLSLSIGISTSAFLLVHFTQYLFVSIIQLFIEPFTFVIEHSLTHIGYVWLYLCLIMGLGILLRRVSFNITNWLPQTVQNRYLAILILFGTVELLSILLLNADYLVNLAHPENPIKITHLLPFFHVVVLTLFVLIIILLRIYLNITINRVEHETQTPYLQNINDLIASIRSIKHDAVNHYTAINGLVKFGCYELATDYVKQLIHEASNIFTVIDGVTNSSLSALLHSKMAICIANKIPFSVSVTSKSQFHFMKSNELVTMVGTLLDYAIRVTIEEAEEDRSIRMIWQDENKHSSLLVENSGPPIPAEELAHLFHPSYAVNSSTKGKNGLATVKKIVSRHKGSIQVSSEQGRTRILIQI